jgi:hypothetical protein
MGLLSDDAKREQLIYCIIFGAACIIFLISVAVLNIESEAMKNRFANAEDMLNGNLVNFEYPPLVLVLIAIPRLFASAPFGYSIGFVAEMFVFFVFGLLIVAKLAKKYGRDEKRFMLAYTILMLLLTEFAVDRFDIVPAVLTLGAVYCFVTKRYTLAFILLSMGTMIKLYPAVLFPIFLIPFINNRDWGEVLKGTAVFVAASLAVIIPVMILQPDLLTGTIEYHIGRPLQIETLAASFIYPFSMLGLTDVTILGVLASGFGSDDLVGGWADPVASLMLPLMVMSIVAVYVLYAYMLKRTKGVAVGNDRLYLFANAMLLSVMLFIMIGKVFSSQFLLWIIPPLLFVFMVSPDPKWARKVFFLFAAILLVTQLQFAYNVGFLGGGENINDIGMMLILARNILMVIMLYLIVRPIYDRCRSLMRPSAQNEG